MFLKRIEIQGFKSFADKTVLIFDQDITGIVGPNGCGKSNINDAIRWVLGEQSVKSLRSGSSMSDIIFSGSEIRRPVNMAKVTLVFDNTKHVFDSPFEEIEITRQLTRSTNEASYFINKTPCRLKDINDLVMDTGLGRDSLSIITQGNISSFADAKPEERRLLFEEAAGVAKYKKRKKVSLSKLEKAKENLDRLQDILDEIESRLGPLERQAKKANKYTALRNELSKIEISVLVEEIDSLNKEIQSLKNQLFETRTVYASKEASLSTQDQTIHSLRNETYKLDREINELQGELSKAMQESYQLDKRKVELDERRKYTLRTADVAARRQELSSMLSEAKFEYEDRQNRLSQTRADYDLHIKNMNALKTQINTYTEQLHQAETLYRQLESRKQVLDNIVRQPFANQAGVRSVMEAKESLGGIEGAVSDLIIPHDHRASAINAALGGAIYNIVSRDERSARNAIAYLKRNRSGRATFLPMDISRPRYPSDQQDIIARNAEGFIGWAYEEVDCDDKYRNVCDRLLGNVLIVDNLEHANEAAKRLRYQIKIVTLDGDIVHIGGSMTGGVQRNNSTAITVREELGSIINQLQEQKTRCDSLSARVRNLQRQLDDESDEAVNLQVESARLENITNVKKEKYESALAEYNQLSGDDTGVDVAEDDLVVLMSRMHERIDDINARMQSLRKRRFDKGTEVEQLENQLRLTRREMSAAQNDIHSMEVSLTRYETRLESALNRLNADYKMTYEYAASKKEDIEIDAAKDRVNELRDAISRLGNVNMDAPEEYRETKERYDFMSSQKEDLIKASEQIKAVIDEMDQKMISQFTDMFNRINSELDGIFKAMFGGGKARLTMVDPDDVLNTGIDIDVQPPGKLVKNIQTFSGGEKALIAISVLFAILQARTMPLCIFDEVEAALDQANVERFARYLSRFRESSQFIVVTHRPGTMEQCDTLYGVTMQKDGVSQLLKVKLKDAITIAEKEEDD